MNQLSLKNNWFRFKTAGNLQIHVEGNYGIFLNLIKKNSNMLTCNWLISVTLGSQLIISKNPPGHWALFTVIQEDDLLTPGTPWPSALICKYCVQFVPLKVYVPYMDTFLSAPTSPRIWNTQLSSINHACSHLLTYFEHFVWTLLNTRLFLCQFLDLHLKAYHSNIGVQIIVVFDLRTSTLCNRKETM